ncbi:DUF6318 family protein [Arthrobacter sp. M4]|uniref:DUF6318 family protein n=1 Tax=Arthrobacter sp. M4 TaxID=218160 RepID=UPI001CDC9A11|nr:DUF6318 family protein [Arthrobacter sp. M4]MCA4133944.1 DUF6318 family protein [Arthrobacter sp. M4]
MTFLFCAARRRQWLPVAAAVLVIWMAGCSAEATPEASGSTIGSVSPSASETPTPTVTPKYKPADAKGRAENVPVPVLPEAAKAETKEGLLAFGRYWFDQLNYAYETGDVTGLNAVTSPTCEFCVRLSTSLNANYTQGVWLSGGKLRTPSLSSTYKLDRTGNFQVIVQVQQDRIDYHSMNAPNYKLTPPSDTGNVMLVVFKDGGWYLNDLHPIR